MASAGVALLQRSFTGAATCRLSSHSSGFMDSGSCAPQNVALLSRSTHAANKVQRAASCRKVSSQEMKVVLWPVSAKLLH
jgi:hypothetical protein